MVGWASPVFIAVLLGAGWSDIVRRRIPNVLTVGLAALGVGYHYLSAGTTGLWHSGAGLGCGLLILAIPFALRKMGGGDIKLFAAVGAWYGASKLLVVGLVAAVIGGMMGMGLILKRRFSGHYGISAAKGSVPFGVAIAAAAIMFVWWL